MASYEYIFKHENSICFDLDNTLIDRNKACERFFVYLLGIVFDGLERDRVAWHNHLNALRVLDDGGRGDKLEIYRYCMKLNNKLTSEDFVRLMRKKIASYSSWSDGAKELLDVLKSRGYPMALVTNGSDSQRQKIEKLGASEYFDVILISKELGIEKPAAGIFMKAMTLLNSTPKHSVFIGDSYNTDISGAKKVGMMTVYVNHKDDEQFDEKQCDLIVPNIRVLLNIVRKSS